MDHRYRKKHPLPVVRQGMLSFLGIENLQWISQKVKILQVPYSGRALSHDFWESELVLDVFRNK